jgi:hypothetical protein
VEFEVCPDGVSVKFEVCPDEVSVENLRFVQMRFLWNLVTRKFGLNRFHCRIKCENLKDRQKTTDTK